MYFIDLSVSFKYIIVDYCKNINNLLKILWRGAKYMRILNKRDYIYLFILIFLFLFIVLFIAGGSYYYGSNTDWNQQHWVFPEYFRNLFYETRDFLPNFAFNLGAGQNIFNFSYYGLFSPIILPSYFLPFVDMRDYIIIISIFLVILSIVLFYIWLRKNRFDSFICFIVGAVFLFSAPLIFHSHRQIMFTNYIPFLIMGLMGVDRFFREGKSGLLIISIPLMILTSYYFSVSGLVVLIVYSIYVIMKKHLRFKDFLSFCFPLVLGFLIAGFFLMPTFAALMNGRTGSGDEMSIMDLILPNLSFIEYISSPYSIGTTAISFLAIIWGIFSKHKEKIFLASSVFAFMLFPMFLYILNGSLYIRAKVLIPFLPLICLLTALFFKDYSPLKFGKIKHIMASVLIIFLAFLGNSRFFNLVFILEILLFSLLTLLYYKFKKRAIILMPVAIISFASCLVINKSDLLVPYNENNIQTMTENINQNETNLYRTTIDYDSLNNANRIYSDEYYVTTLYSSIYNSDYKDFYFNTFSNEVPYRNVLNMASTKNILFNIYMGNKYLITDGNAQSGYEKISSNANLTLYKNEDVFPLGYVTENIMSEYNYNRLEYPYNQEALLNNCVTGDSGTSTYKSSITEISEDFFSINSVENLTFVKDKENYIISSEREGEMVINIPESLKNKIIFIKFNMDYQSDENDTYIIINGVKNKLSGTSAPYPNNNFEFEYVLSSNQDINNIDLSFSKGNYSISDIQIHYMDYANLEGLSDRLDPLIIDMEKTKGDKIYGYINVTKDGYFVLNIPYDKGFSIKVDGQEIKYQKVNKAFIGFKIGKGEKNIEITYEAPLFKTGIIVSIIGIAFATIYLLSERKRRFLK